MNNISCFNTKDNQDMPTFSDTLTAIKEELIDSTINPKDLRIALDIINRYMKK